MFWITRLLPLALLLLMGGCASLTSYTITESEVEHHLQRQVAAFDREQLESGSPLSVALGKVDVELGPDGRDVVVLDVNGEVALNALMMRVPVDVALKLEGAPVYSSEDRAVYIRRLKLLDSRVDSPYFKGDLKPATDAAMRVLAQMLETMPVYRLDESDYRQRLIGSVPLDIKVERGRLRIVPAD